MEINELDRKQKAMYPQKTQIIFKCQIKLKYESQRGGIGCVVSMDGRRRNDDYRWTM